jgi:hypothetical protein
MPKTRTPAREGHVLDTILEGEAAASRATIQRHKGRPAELLTDDDLSRLLTVEKRTLRLWRQTQGLPFLRLTAKVIRYRRPDVEAWMSRRRVVIAA